MFDEESRSRVGGIAAAEYPLVSAKRAGERRDPIGKTSVRLVPTSTFDLRAVKILHTRDTTPACLSTRYPSPQAAPPSDPNQARWFEKEVHAHEASLKSYLRSSFPAVRDVDDVVQDSFLRVWQRQMLRPITAVTGSVKASVKSFLFQVARRRAIDVLRHERASPFDAVTEIERSAVTEDRTHVSDAVCSQQEFELLLEAIDTLPARCREVLILRKLQGLGSGEVAERLGISDETVHVQMRRGLLRVQEILRKRGVIRESKP